MNLTENLSLPLSLSQKTAYSILYLPNYLLFLLKELIYLVFLQIMLFVILIATKIDMIHFITKLGSEEEKSSLVSTILLEL